MINFPAWIPGCDSHSPAPLDLFISSDASICSTRSSHLLGNSDHVVVSVSIDVPSNSQRMPRFIALFVAILLLIGMVFVIISEMFFGRSASAAASELVIVAKGFLKLPNLHMVIKQKSPLLPRNLAPGTFGELLIVFSTKVNLLYLLNSAARMCCLLHLINQNYFQKTFLRTLILMTQLYLYLFSLLELI